MALTVCVLGSGSSGNCTYVASGETALLIDAGLSGAQVRRRLDTVGAARPSPAAVCVTHEHNDHRTALPVLHRRHGLALYGNAGTIEAIERDARFRGLAWNVFLTGTPFEIGDLRIEPFSVPHDSYDPVGFIVSCDGARVGVVTDIGMVTELVRQRLRGCGAVVLEANHDADLLREAARPWALKQRIAGRQGHLSNADAAALAAEVAGPELRAVCLAHLSADCNRPDLAVTTVREALCAKGWNAVAVHATYPDRPGVCVTL
jgi:phosphoribosyl 1,2-cyclic phosphodiesterase